MKDTIQLLCILSIGAMMGSVGTSFYLEKQNSLSESVMPAKEYVYAPYEAPPVIEFDQSGSEAETPKASTQDNEVIKEQFERVMSYYESIHAKQVAMDQKMKEANRDLLGLQFQVDTHSESFRPLRVSQQMSEPNQPSLTPGLLPAKGTLPSSN